MFFAALIDKAMFSDSEIFGLSSSNQFCVDPTKRDEVLWAFTTRCHPHRGIFSTGSSWGIPLLPFLSPHEKLNYMGSQVLFDCTWPKDWPEKAIPIKASFEEVWPADIQQKVIENWSEYGYES